MAVRLKTGFSTATNPALTPIPFDSVVEDPSNDVFYGATQGKNASPGMRMTLSNTVNSSRAYGIVDMTTRTSNGLGVPLQGHHFRVRFSLSVPTITGFANTNEVTVVRLIQLLGGVDTEIASLIWQRTTTGYRWKIQQNIAGTTSVVQTADFTTTPATFYDIMFDCIGSPGCEYLQASVAAGNVDDATTNKIQFALPTTATGRLPSCTKVFIGAVAMNIANPSAASEFVMDDIRIEDDQYEADRDVEPLNGGNIIKRSGTRELEMVQFRLKDNDYATIGAVGGGALNIMPGSGFMVRPNTVYELFAVPFTLPSQAFGNYIYFLPQKYFGSDDAFVSGFNLFPLPDTTIWLDIVKLGRYEFKTLSGQNTIWIYNNQKATVQFTLRRARG